MGISLSVHVTFIRYKIHVSFPHFFTILESIIDRIAELPQFCCFFFQVGITNRIIHTYNSQYNSFNVLLWFCILMIATINWVIVDSLKLPEHTSRCMAVIGFRSNQSKQWRSLNTESSSDSFFRQNVHFYPYTIYHYDLVSIFYLRLANF